MRDSKEKIMEGMADHLKNFVEKPSPAFGGLPICPFSKKGRQDGKIMYEIHPFPPTITEKLPERLNEVFSEFCHNQNAEVLMVIHPDSEAITVKEMEGFMEELNKKIAEMDLVAFGGHPRDRFNIQGVYTRQAPYIHFTVQRNPDVKRASEILAQTPYYENWTRENLNQVGFPQREET
ncbi:hypothetical protein [Phormidium sp. CCY1219]|uniref:hypothetical protein n=1 Tax=Phormidium sp. CCY1219 TaxID=2886104 RepID=UPI002D1F1A87|nr:hypothetical protein [Phormidium sp. CCY1219]MEB3829811.1 hypothetical protein [Phormidium sp. CCY1219]